MFRIFLQETYEIEDLLFYPKLDGTETIYQVQGSTTVTNGEMYGGSGYLSNGFDNTGNWEMTFQAKWSNTRCGIWLIKDTETSRDKNDVLMIPNRVYAHVNGSNVFNQQLYNVSQNTYYTFKLTKNNDTLTIEVNGNSSNLTWSLLNTLSTLTVGVDSWGGTSYIKNIKVKAL